METSLPGLASPEERKAGHRQAEAPGLPGCNICVQADLTCAGNVVTLCEVQSYFSGTWASFEQRGCRACVAECLWVTALELGNDII